MVFEPVSPSFKYDKNKLELRKVYKNICVQNRHSLQYDEAVAMSKTTESFFNFKRSSKGGTAPGRNQNYRNNSNRTYAGGKMSSYNNNDMMNSFFPSRAGQSYYLRNVGTPGYGLDQSTDLFDGKINDSLMSIGNKKSHVIAPSSTISGFYGGNKFHSSKANWDPHNSIVRESSLISSPTLRVDSQDAILENNFYNALHQIRCNSRTRRQ